jgi:hypothetical protein
MNDPYTIVVLIAGPLGLLYALKGDEMGKVLSTGKSVSKSFSLDGTDLWKLIVGGLIVGAGAFLTSLTEGIEGVDFGEWTPHVTAGMAVLVNLARKFLADNTK